MENKVKILKRIVDKNKLKDNGINIDKIIKILKKLNIKFHI